MTTSLASTEFAPATQTELARFLRENARGERRALMPVGGRTALHYGFPLSRDALRLSTARLTRVVDYPARDMTITVEAGLRIDDLAATLRAERQQLAIDVPQSNRATVGGTIACNTSGPRRFGYGTLRDSVIGISAVDSSGRLFKAGGRVVKNVAGYDLCKLLVGSLGTLAVVTQATFKLRPVPETMLFLWATFDSLAILDEVLGRLITSGARPVAVEVLNPVAAQEIAAEARQDLPADRPVLAVAVEGAEADAAWQLERLAMELTALHPLSIDALTQEESTSLLAALTEFPTISDDPLTFKAILSASKTIEFIGRATAADVSIVAHAANGIVIGHLPDTTATVEQAETLLAPLRSFVRRHRGNLIILNCDAEWTARLPMFGEPEPSWPLMRKLKETLDPHGLLNPGRFIDGAIERAL
ncbi:MAG: FAD-binding oxidoreductase [Planctomycetaceae bacterium]